jgi:HTH-type transcriptional regulator/antitoxin MqsA
MRATFATYTRTGIMHEREAQASILGGVLEKGLQRVPGCRPEGHGRRNASIVDPTFIANVRKKLALDQREAAEIFGGGINAFSRYENGKTRPPLALVQLFKVLDRHPELLDEIRAA